MAQKKKKKKKKNGELIISFTTISFHYLHSWLIYTYNHRLLDFYKKTHTNIFKRTETKMEAECHTNNLLQYLSTNCCRKDYDLQQFSYDSGCGYCYSTTDRKDELLELLEPLELSR